MLRREELITCGTGARGAPWEPARAGKEEEVREAYQQQLKEGAPRRGCSRARWHHSWRGRTPTFSRKLLGSRTHAHYHQQQHYSQRCYRPTRPRVLLSLRPVNMMGKRAPGMRAPRNTNQFLMREKYQLMHLRSDSVGTESGGSDSEMDPQGLDSYLGVLENSRGALMDFAEDSRSSSWSPPASSAATDSSPSPQQQQLRVFGGGLADVHQEESLQYFPSEDDVIESETFMERDFHEFCSRIA